MTIHFRRIASVISAIIALGACATAVPPNTALVQAKSVYASLQTRGAEQRVDADMERAKAAIDRADSSTIETQGADYVNAVSEIALHLAQAAEAKETALEARQSADSLRAARLARLLTLSESQRADLLAKNQLTQAEVETLRMRNATVTQREDSMRMETMAERMRGDSLRNVAQAAQRQADSLTNAAAGATRELTYAERERTDSLRLVARSATQLADSLRGAIRYSARAQDSVRIAQGAEARTSAAERMRADSIRMMADQSAREMERMRVARERQRADSFQTTARQTAAQLDSARRVGEQSGRERDSLRTAMTAASRQADSLRNAVAAAARARDSLRVLNEQLTALQRTTAGLRDVKMTERGLVISLSGVLFDPGKSVLKPGAVRNVRRIAQVLQQYPNYHLSVEGHTDSIGRADRNQTLSEQRADAVQQALTAGGVDASRVTVKGFGATQPVATNTTLVGRQQNRRVEIVVLGAGGTGTQ